MPHRESYPLSDTDTRGRCVTVPAPPQRIVSLVPSQTELLVQLGLRDRIVGVTRFCVHPEDIKDEKQVVGGTKNVCVDRVKALRPDFILGNIEENTRGVIRELENVAPVYITDVYNIPTAVDMIRSVGRLVQRREYAGGQARTIARRFENIPFYDPPLLAAYFIWRNPYMTIGHDTFIHDVMRYAGLINVFGKRTRYPEISADEIAEADPDLVLLADEPFPFQDKHIAEIEAFLPNTPVLLVDGQYFSWYGSRLRDVPAYLKELRAEIEDRIDLSVYEE